MKRDREQGEPGAQKGTQYKPYRVECDNVKRKLEIEWRFEWRRWLPDLWWCPLPWATYLGIRIFGVTIKFSYYKGKP